MPALAFQNQPNDEENASGAGTWLIPIFLVALLFGVAVAVFKSSFKFLCCRALKSVHIEKDTMSRSNSAQSGNDREVKRGSDALRETSIDVPAELPEPHDVHAPYHKRLSFSHEPQQLPSQQYLPVLCSSFSEDSLRSLHDLLEADECWLHGEDAEQIYIHKSVDIPRISFTSPTIEDLASFAVAPVYTLANLLQAPDTDRFGHAVPQSKSMPSLSTLTSNKTKSKINRSISVVGGDIMGRNGNRGIEAEFVGSFLAALHNTEKMVQRLQDGCTNGVQTQILDGRRRNSITLKVSVPSTNDLWKLWVCRDETVEGFTARVRDKVGVDVALFTHKEDMIVSEDDWRLVTAGHKIIARPA